MIMYKKDTVHNVTQLKQYDVQKNTLYIMCHNVKKKKNNTMMYKKKMLYIMCHNVKSTIFL